MSEDERDLSFEYVGVLIGNDKRVAEEVIIQWQGNHFPVWVMEDVDDRLPEFLKGRNDNLEKDNGNDDEEKERVLEEKSNTGSESFQSESEGPPENTGTTDAGVGKSVESAQRGINKETKINGIEYNSPSLQKPLYEERSNDCQFASGPTFCENKTEKVFCEK
ncbi:hypothetical protein Hanom_Chr15g01397671 [Helianthus anomalus]